MIPPNVIAKLSEKKTHKMKKDLNHRNDDSGLGVFLYIFGGTNIWSAF